MRMLVVDDDPNVLEALALAFELQWENCEILTAGDGDKGLALFYDYSPDVVMLDVSMPGKSGFDVLKEIRCVSDVPVLMLTARNDEMDLVRGLGLGADEYVTKPFGHLALLARVKAVLRRAQMPAPVDAIPDFVAGDLAINFENHQVTLRSERVNLTPVEYKVLYHLARNAGRVLPYQTLLDRVWGADYGAPVDYLKVFVSRLRAKLEVPGGPRYIFTERGLGYRFARPPAADSRLTRSATA